MLAKVLTDLLRPSRVAHAHCDLPCGVYDPAQAKIEAQSVKACMEKYHGSDDHDFKARAVSIKEERSDLVKHHLWVLWTDYFKPEHVEKYPQLHEVFWNATKEAGNKAMEAGNKAMEAAKEAGDTANIKLPTNTGLKGLDREQQVKKMEEFVFMVVGN